MRLFIAIRLDPGICQAVQRLQEEMQKQGVSGRFTKPENLHITLAFIGEYAQPEDVLEIMDAIPFESFRLTRRGIGVFDDVWWLGIEGSAALSAYVKRLRHALADAGIPFDRRAFIPHVTLVRGAKYHREGLPALEFPELEIYADHVVLMRSDRGKDGMIYTGIGSVSAHGDQMS